MLRFVGAPGGAFAVACGTVSSWFVDAATLSWRPFTRQGVDAPQCEYGAATLADGRVLTIDLTGSSIVSQGGAFTLVTNPIRFDPDVVIAKEGPMVVLPDDSTLLFGYWNARSLRLSLR